MNPTSQQIRSYTNDGFLLLSGLVERKTVERARQALLRHVSHVHSNTYHAFVSDSAVLACFNKDICSTASQLAGVRKRFAPPATVYTISVFPTAEEWKWPAAHIDHAREEDAHQTFPPPFTIGCLIYLTDIQPHCGGTVVWPGSHLRLEARAAAEPERYRHLSSLNRDIEKFDLGDPIEITAQSGDVLFYHYLCAHAGSGNTGTEPRLALNHKW